jgi:hypothetical protein
MNGHDVLVKARNSIEREGFDVNLYALWGGPCGTPRCVLGWCGFHGGLADKGNEELFQDDAPSAYRSALRALWETRPAPPMDDADTLAGKVERVAFALSRVHGNGTPAELRMVLAWFDKAIAVTAPEPDTTFLASFRQPEGASA